MQRNRREFKTDWSSDHDREGGHSCGGGEGRRVPVSYLNLVNQKRNNLPCIYSS